MPQRYDLEKIKDLLTEAFTDEELRCFCYDTPEFTPVYNQLDQDITKWQVVDKLIKHAARKSLFDTLLKLAQECYPTVYLKHRPYSDDPVHTVASNDFPNKAQKDTRTIMSSFAKKAVRPIVIIIGLIGSLNLENVADNPQNKQQKIEKKANSVQSTSSSLKTVKIQALEKRLTKLLAEYEVVSQQLSNELNEVNRVRLNGQLEMLEKEISRLEDELNSVK